MLKGTYTHGAEGSTSTTIAFVKELALTDLKVPQLKELCKKHDIKPTGNKKALIELLTPLVGKQGAEKENGEENKVEENRVEENKGEESKVEENKVEENKVEESKVEENKGDDQGEKRELENKTEEMEKYICRGNKFFLP